VERRLAAQFIGKVLEVRLERILERYLTRLSPLGDVHIEGGSNLCALDLARRREVRSRATTRSPFSAP
jgi:hypothetical protein